MALLDLKTDLKSLKYGQDQPGGGSSRQPYIVTNINTVDSGINKLRFTKFDDGLIRGGAIGAANAAIVDTIRIGKFFTDLPQGPLFIAKQVGLQLSNPRLESTTYTDKPVSGQGLLNNAINFVSNVVNKIGSEVGPTRIYNLGVNTLTQVPVNALGGHIMRHGLLPTNDEDKLYYNVVRTNNFDNNTNRLEKYANTFLLGGFQETAPNKFNDFPELTNYIGGPSSVYGIGTTAIRKPFDAITNNWNKISKSIDFSKTYAGLSRKTAFPSIIKETFDYGLSNKSFSFYASGTFDLSSSIDPNYPVGGYVRIASREDKQNPFQYLPEINYYNTLNLSKQYFQKKEVIENQTDISPDTPTITPSYTRQNAVDFRAFEKTNPSASSVSVYTYADVKTQLASQQISGSKALSGRFIYRNIENKILNNPPLYGPTELHNQTAKESDKINTDLIPNNLPPGFLINTSNQLATAFGGQPTLSPSPNYTGIYATLVNKQLNKERLPNSSNKPTYKNAYGDTVVVNIDGGWAKATREIRVGSGRQDSINLTPIFRAKAGTHSDTITIPGIGTLNINDLVKFRIQAVNTDNPELASWMVFRAYITDLSDNVDATWNEVKYAGRGDKFYIYDGYSRKMSVSFKVAALSEKEMKPMYQKLNFLMSNLMPDYNNNNLMRGPLVRMTIGNWIDGQLAKLDSLSYKIPQDSPWEISIDENINGTSTTVKPQILPHIVEVTLGFTPIGSQTGAQNKLSEKITTTSHIAQNWNEPGFIKGSEDTVLYDETTGRFA